MNTKQQIEKQEYFSLITLNKLKKLNNTSQNKEENEFDLNIFQNPIQYSEKLQKNKQARKEYILNILRNTNPSLKNKPKCSLNQILVNQIKNYKNYKKSMIQRKYGQFDQISKQMQNLLVCIDDQKQINKKYEQRINNYYEQLQRQLKSKYKELNKERINKQVQFCKRIDGKISKMEQQIKNSTIQQGQQSIDNQNKLGYLIDGIDKNRKKWMISQFNSKISQFRKNSQSNIINQLLNNFNQTKKQFTKLKGSLSCNKKQLIQLIRNKKQNMMQQFNQISLQIQKLDNLKQQIIQYHQITKSKIQQMKKQRINRQNYFIMIVQKILDYINQQYQMK